jgi:SAM-dependent methyltransferase
VEQEATVIAFNLYDDPQDMRKLLEFSLDRTIPEWVRVDHSLTMLDLGPGEKWIEHRNVHRLDWPEWDGEKGLLRYPSDSIGGIFAINILEHLRDPRPLIREFGRVLAPGCPATIWVPHARSGMYLQDLDHKTPFILDTWKNLLEDHPYYAKDHGGYRLRIGVNVLFGLKEENVGILTQLIKEDPDE